MKKTFSRALIAAIVFTFFSCLKEDHKIRFKNNYSQVLYNVSAGSASFGTVVPGGVSGYQSVNAGNFTISGNTSTGQPLIGGGSVTGKGKHKWTLTLSAAGQVSIAEDK